MERARELYNRVRRDLSELERQIVGHPLLVDAKEGRLGIEAVRRFASNQWYIVNHDLRSLAIMMSRSSDGEELEYFKRAVDLDYEALRGLAALLDELGIPRGRPSEAEISPAATAYTHYIAWLALYASPGAVAFAFAVNLPTWGAACSSLGEALRAKYGIKSLEFFQAFRGPYEPFIERSLAIASRYVGQHGGLMVAAARTIQAYEKMFWDSIYRG